jgi:hypothetical protein
LYTVALAENLGQIGALNMAKIPELSLFFFSADSIERQNNKYEMLLETAKFADEYGFTAVWTPERHFQRFGGLYGRRDGT